jgi:hypothetical protein
MKLKSLIIPTEAKTDLGLQHYLAAIEPSNVLGLGSWEVTDAGIAELQQALPNCKITK